MANKIRSLLTGLGIIFGVAAVITMIAIGQGAKQEILSQLDLIGVNNIVITPIFEQKEGDTQGDEPEVKKETQKFSKGLDLTDALSMVKVIPNISGSSPEIVVNISAIYAGKFRSTKLIGVGADYFEISNIEIDNGSKFSGYQLENAQAVCIIGSGIEKRLFIGKNPIG